MARASADADELRSLTQRLFRRFGALASSTTPCGQPLPLAHAHALQVLLARGELAQRELGAELCIDKSNVARLCARMVAAGHVSQRASDHDGRSRRVTLTRQGERVAGEVDAASRARFSALLRELPPTEREPTVGVLRELVRAVERLPDARARAGRKDK
ncbi:MAG: winged helix-turn-helix transcriptional regulator [Myxococcales bacterium]|nr:winged helix-turn-helix transcriptional regulator [Myxococcales bacterium]